MTDQDDHDTTPSGVVPGQEAVPSAPDLDPAAGGEVGADGASPQRRSRHTVVVPGQVSMVSLLGTRDELLRVVERAFPRVDVLVRGNEVTLEGPVGDVALVERLVDEMTAVLGSGQHLSPDAVERSIGMLRHSAGERPADVLTLNVLSHRGRTIRPKTVNQKRYVDAIDQHTVVFGIGPAGTGKTYLAMAKAVQALQAKSVNRIILTRPAVEAGERLGFLPGTLTEKIDPYLQAPVRRSARHARPGLHPPADGGRDHRGGAVGLHARADPQRRVHHPRRGAEHLDRADEDVPDAPRVRFQDGRHR